MIWNVSKQCSVSAHFSPFHSAANISTTCPESHNIFNPFSDEIKIQGTIGNLNNRKVRQSYEIE